MLVLGSQLSLNSSSVWEWSMKGDSTGSASLYALQVGRSIGHRRTVKEAEPVSKWMTPQEGRQEWAYKTIRECVKRVFGSANMRSEIQQRSPKQHWAPVPGSSEGHIRELRNRRSDTTRFPSSCSSSWTTPHRSRENGRNHGRRSGRSLAMSGDKARILVVCCSRKQERKIETRARGVNGTTELVIVFTIVTKLCLGRKRASCPSQTGWRRGMNRKTAGVQLSTTATSSFSSCMRTSSLLSELVR